MKGLHGGNLPIFTVLLWCMKRAGVMQGYRTGKRQSPTQSEGLLQGSLLPISRRPHVKETLAQLVAQFGRIEDRLLLYLLHMLLSHHR